LPVAKVFLFSVILFKGNGDRYRRFEAVFDFTGTVARVPQNFIITTKKISEMPFGKYVKNILSEDIPEKPLLYAFLVRGMAERLKVFGPSETFWTKVEKFWAPYFEILPGLGYMEEFPLSWHDHQSSLQEPFNSVSDTMSRSMRLLRGTSLEQTLPVLHAHEKDMFRRTFGRLSELNPTAFPKYVFSWCASVLSPQIN